MDAQDTLSRKEIKKQQSNFLLPGRPWTIELPLWIPGYAGSFAYGDVSIEGEDGYDPVNPIEPPDGLGGILSRIFTDEWYLKFFFMGRAVYENNRIIVQADALTGSVGESVKFNYNNREIVEAHYRSSSIRLFGGYKIINADSKNEKFRYELFAYLGARMHFNKIYAELGGSPTLLDISPSWAEPITGLQNQFTWKRWFVVVQGDLGGYFINSKYSTQLSTFVNYKLGLLTSLKLGWNHLALNQEGTLLKQDYNVKATFSGPSIGISFNF
jgi:hypothetical protein